MTTEADGVFEFTRRTDPQFGFTLSCEADGRVGGGADWLALRGGEVIDLQDIGLPRGTIVRGRALDEAGNPVSGVRLSFGRLSEAAPLGALLTQTGAGAATDEDGEFLVTATLQEGTWRLRRARLSMDEYRILEPVTFEASPNLPEVHVEVVLEPPAPVTRVELPGISGRVVDEDGEPVARLQLRVQNGRVSIGASTDRQGRFTIRQSERIAGTPAWENPVSILTDSRAGMASTSGTQGPSGYEPLHPEQTWSWGDTDVLVIVRRPSETEILVVEEGTGTPVQGFGVLYHPEGELPGLQARAVRQSTQNPEGRMLLTGPKRGRHHVMIFPDNPELSPSSPLTVDIGSLTEPLRVELPPRLPLQVRVLTDEESPVRGSKVQLVHYEGEDLVTLRTPVLLPAHGVSGGSRVTMGLLLDSGTTDGEGLVTLRAPSWTEPVALRLMGPGHAPEVRTGISVHEGMEMLTLQVSRGAVLRGRIRPLSLVERIGPSPEMQRAADLHGSAREEYLATYEAFPTVTLHQGDLRFPEPERYDMNAGFRVRSDGTFVADGVPSGTVEVHLRGRWWNEPGGQSSYGRSIGSVELLEGEALEKTFQLSDPGRVAGQVFLDGRPYQGKLTVATTENAPGLRFRVSGIPTDAEGRFKAVVMPGVYQVRLQLSGGEIACPEIVEVQPGGTVQQVFQASLRRLILKILTHEGEPVAKRQFQGLDTTIGSFFLQPTTDADGLLILDPAPSGTFSIYTWPLGFDPIETLNPNAAQYRIVLGPITVPDGEDTEPLELRLPEGVR